MRRLLAFNLIAVLLAPWIAAASGANLVVPCPMHRVGEAASHDRSGTMANMDREGADSQHGSHHGTSARGCNCAGECGRSGAAFSLPVIQLVRVGRRAATDVAIRHDQPVLTLARRLLPPATGPPQRLQA